jgi:myo-inositol 2-dehydrogenase/D-chiro-inositol 1-dehydrogenase
VTVTCDPQIAFSDPAVDGVIIASSTASHVDLILSAVSAKKAVYCEKPISDCLEKTGLCYQAAAEADLPLFCAFNRRFDPSYSTIQAQVRAGAVGHVQTIKSVSRDSPIIPLSYIGPSGGIFDDFSVHDIDLLLWVTGDVPVQVFVSGNSQVPEFSEHNDFDNMIILLNFKHGTLGTIDLNRYSSYGYDQRLEVFGPLGMLHCEHSRPNHVVASDQSGSGRTPLYYSFPSHYHEAFKNQLNHFVDLVRGRVRLSVTEKMTRAVSKVVQACKECVASGLPVKITWSADEIPEY